MTMSKRTDELVRLIERDYDQTSEFIHSIVSAISTMRGWSVTVWLALLGFSIEKNSASLALLAGLVLFPFALLDLYHSWLYGEALKHARALERLSAEYFSAVEIGEDDEDLMIDFEEKAATHRYGLFRNFRRFQLPEIRAARPELVFRYFYPGLLMGAFLAAGLIAIFT
jgi:hypothetical protein